MVCQFGTTRIVLPSVLDHAGDVKKSGNNLQLGCNWYFTAPWEPTAIRRGDALGLRAGADYFSDLLAPGLSNSTFDARWITILCWCLKWSHLAWKNAGGGDLSRRDVQLERYAWLRPLELLWVDRALALGQTTGQLRGRRSVERWRKADRRLANFAMSRDQFGRFRQTGTYGAYRVVLRTMPGLTKGDGWTPDASALALSTLVNERLPVGARVEQSLFDGKTRWSYWRGEEARFWVERGWATPSIASTSNFLPSDNESVIKQLPEAERKWLETILFGADSTRRITAQVLESARRAASHADLCDTLAHSNELARILGRASLAPLPSFTRFADSAMNAMRTLWFHLNQDGEQQAPAIEKIARLTAVCSSLDQVRQAGETWLKAQGRGQFPHDRVVTQLATNMRTAHSSSDQLRALTRHHAEFGGGRRWFQEVDGKLRPLVADTGVSGSDYRFRLSAVSRLATQCGVARMPRALEVAAAHDDDDRLGGKPGAEEDDYQ